MPAMIQKANSGDPHPIDHFVLPTADLAVAEDRLAALGFTVAPRGQHPFGTENACVYLADGTFLEPLAIADAQAVAAAIAEKNVFVARDEAWRSANGEEGFSALVFGTPNAKFDHKSYEDQGVSGGPMLKFGREVTDASGKTDTAAFQLAFAADQTAPDVFFFACERINAPKVNRQALQLHANGAYASVGVVASAPEPRKYAGLMLAAANAAFASTSSFGLELGVPNGAIAICRDDAIENHFGIKARVGGGLRLQAIRFAVTELHLLEQLLSENGVAFHYHGDHVVVPATAGQGAAFIFEDGA